MNIDSVKDIFNGATVNFVEYFKNKFKYTASKDGYFIEVWLGDEDGDIYRDYWEATYVLDFSKHNIHYIKVSKDSKVIYDEYGEQPNRRIVIENTVNGLKEANCYIGHKIFKADFHGDNLCNDGQHLTLKAVSHATAPEYEASLFIIQGEHGQLEYATKVIIYAHNQPCIYACMREELIIEACWDKEVRALGVYDFSDPNEILRFLKWKQSHELLRIKIVGYNT
jgi:hypothetical protein